MRRLAALVVAVALVAGAVWIRGRLTDDDPAGSGSPAEVSEAYRLLCVTELRAVCETLEGQEGLDVATESAGDTAARLSAAGVRPSDAGFDGWLAPRVWVDVVADARQRAGTTPVLEPGAVAAHSPLVLAALPARLTELQAACTPFDWRCVGAQAGPLKIGADRPTDGAWGLAVLGQRAAGWFGRAEISANELRETPEFRSWLTAVEQSAFEDGTPAAPAAALLITKQGTFDVVGTVGAGVPPRAQSAPIGPSAAVDLVVAAPVGGGAAGEERLSRVRRALVAQGWVDGPSATAALPAGGTLVALLDLWERVNR